MRSLLIFSFVYSAGYLKHNSIFKDKKKTSISKKKKKKFSEDEKKSK